MASNFAPYQSSPPTSPPHTAEDPWAKAAAQRLPSPSHYTDNDDDATSNRGDYTDLEPGHTRETNDYHPPIGLHVGGRPSSPTSDNETTLPLPPRLLAPLAYLACPPLGAIVLLCLEHRSAYVRFHAWQSALLFAALLLLHIVFSWTKVVSWMLAVVDWGCAGYLAVCAWRHGRERDHGGRVEVPFFGRLASGFVDEE